ncbi:dynamin-related protein 3A [Actinidia rufa]|uniref:Dynamin-related protein 3A n=1 Tax=Actinidia rufa TaxID=165716 RepID=A0A7J0G294_9ERIC|nr:dynamin-related protein 3A [Actinidia rufa]
MGRMLSAGQEARTASFPARGGDDFNRRPTTTTLAISGFKLPHPTQIPHPHPCRIVSTRVLHRFEASPGNAAPHRIDVKQPPTEDIPFVDDLYSKTILPQFGILNHSEKSPHNLHIPAIEGELIRLICDIIKQDIMLNRSIKDALVAEEKFFRSRPVYSDLVDRCGIPQLAKKLNQVGQGALLLNILSKYSEEVLCHFCALKTEPVCFTRSILQEVDPCEDLTDDDIRTAIQNATGPRSALFVPVVPFEVLVRRQITRLLDPSLQCARFIFDELIKMSHHCMVNELQRFPVLRKRMDEVIGNFLQEGLEPSETMIGHIIEMEMDYINTSHPNFIGGSKAVEIAVQQIKSNRVGTLIPRQKDEDPEKAPTSERSLKSRTILARPVNGIVPEQGSRPVADVEKTISSAKATGSSWGIPSIFGGSDSRVSIKENSTNKSFIEPVQNGECTEHAFSMIHLREVNHTKRELHNVFIKKLYRDNLFEEMLQEPDDVAMKRECTRDTLRVLQQAFRTLDELPLEAETVERGYSLNATDPTGLPKTHGLPTSSWYLTSSSSNESNTASPKNPKSSKSSHSGELQSPFYANADSKGNGRNSILGLYN